MKVRDFTSAVFNTDFYKTGHIFQYPENTELVFSNMTPRSTSHWKAPFSAGWDGVVVFGIQSAVQKINESWEDTFFSQPKDEILAKYKQRMDICLGTDAVDIKHISDLHDLGYLPIEIRSLEEGTTSPIGVPVFTIHNTLPEFYWIVNYLETTLSNETWFTMTNATIARTYRNIISKYQRITDGDKSIDGFLCHDFSMRGMMTSHSAGATGASHLTSFLGTDAVPALDFVEYYYDADPQKFIAGSVPATEHSVMCMGMEEGEVETFSRLINKVYPKGIVSIVSDTWDFWRVISEYTVQLKSDIMARDGKVVFRPDTGDPVKILCGYDIFNVDELSDSHAEDLSELGTEFVIYFPEVEKYYLHKGDKRRKEISKWEAIGAVETLWEIFGGTTNAKGYKTLDSHVGLIYGDSITLERCDEILRKLAIKHFAHNNVVFGIGSYTYQYNTRDTLGFAVKATAGIVNGVERNIMKNPKTDTSKSKVSAKGFLKVVKNKFGEYKLIDDLVFAEIYAPDNELKIIFKDGKFVKRITFEEVRKNASKGLFV